MVHAQRRGEQTWWRKRWLKTMAMAYARGGAGGGRTGVAWMVVGGCGTRWQQLFFLLLPCVEVPTSGFFFSFHVCFHSTLCHCLCFISLVPKSSLLLVCFTPVSLFSFSSVRPCFVFSFCCWRCFMLSINVLPSLQRLRGGAGGREWLGWRWWAVAVETGDSSCFLFPSAEALLLLLVSFVPSVNAVLPSLQQLHGGADGREWLGWRLLLPNFWSMFW